MGYFEKRYDLGEFWATRNMLEAKLVSSMGHQLPVSAYILSARFM